MEIRIDDCRKIVRSGSRMIDGQDGSYRNVVVPYFWVSHHFFYIWSIQMAVAPINPTISQNSDVYQWGHFWNMCSSLTLAHTNISLTLKNFSRQNVKMITLKTLVNLTRKRFISLDFAISLLLQTSQKIDSLYDVMGIWRWDDVLFLLKNFVPFRLFSSLL